MHPHPVIHASSFLALFRATFGRNSPRSVSRVKASHAKEAGRKDGGKAGRQEGRKVGRKAGRQVGTAWAVE